MPPKTVTPVKASESVVARMLAKLLGVNPSDDVREVCGEYLSGVSTPELSSFIRAVHGLYPWIADVARDVMSDKTTPFTEHIMSYPGSAFIVKDSARSGADSLWLVIGDPSLHLVGELSNMEHRGLTRTFRLENDLCHIVAIQLNSCRP
jgi:hypothetical protein